MVVRVCARVCAHVSNNNTTVRSSQPSPAGGVTGVGKAAVVPFASELMVQWRGKDYPGEPRCVSGKQRLAGGESSRGGISDARSADSPRRGSFSPWGLGKVLIRIQLGEHRLALLT